MSTWWIPGQKQYLPDTDCWYCDMCKKVTKLERNPEWDGSLKGPRPCPEWFVRCDACGHKHWQATEFDCPECGWDGSDSDSMVSGTKPVYNAYKAYEFGGTPVDWEETHICSECGREFTFVNSNC